MGYKKMTAPCGLGCFNCMFYLADKDDQSKAMIHMFHELMGMGIADMHCRAHQSGIPTFKYSFGPDYVCGSYCCVSEKGLDFCPKCGGFPCDLLHPYADRADKLPHKLKVFKLCQIKNLGREKRAARNRATSFFKWWTMG